MWKTMETAPRDSSWILLYRHIWNTPVVAKWDKSPIAFEYNKVWITDYKHYIMEDENLYWHPLPKFGVNGT